MKKCVVIAVDRKNKDKQSDALTLWLCKLFLLYTIADGLVELGVKDIKVCRKTLIVGKNIFLDGRATARETMISILGIEVRHPRE